MKHSVEISFETFRALCPVDVKCSKSENLENHHVAMYKSNGTTLFAVNSFTAGVTQYYIEDINA
ncbi:hypothetical protein N9043_01900 [bacterium]|nr:hypothetical protein [bacterium]